MSPLSRTSSTGRALRHLYRFLLLIGLSPRETYHFLRGLPPYLRDWRALRRQARDSDGAFPFARLYPCLGDRFSQSGDVNTHYFHQDLLVARRIFAQQPETHLDIGSRLDGFVAHVASFRPIEVMDIRPMTTEIPNVSFLQMDFMQPLAEDFHGYCDSVSCLHAIEHFGLGRYGDPIQYDGYRQALDNLAAIVCQGGKLYLSTPIGPQRIEFNAHRVFSVAFLLEQFHDRFTVDRFSYVDDEMVLHEDVPITPEQAENHYGCHFGCGIFELTRR